MSGTDEIAKTSTLRADAQEFVPRGFQSTGGASQQSGDSAGEQLRSAMHELTLNPGEFDNLLMPLADTMCQWLSEPETISSVVSQVLEQSVAEPNFRYNGARLLNLLNNLDSVASNPFRNLLLERCRVENAAVRQLFDSNPRRLHSFTLFLAELFIQLELSKGSGLKIGVLGEGLMEDLMMLLSAPDNDNLKCACQVLKLAGAHLESAVGTESMDNLEAQLTACMDQVSPNMKFLAESVINLRRHSWGRSPPSPHHAAQPPQQQAWSAGNDTQHNHFSNEPVLYGPDGQMLTAEESRFLQDGMEGGSDGGSDEYDEGMDEELQAAYEQFLQMAPRPS